MCVNLVVMADIDKLEKLAKLVRYYILRMTTKAGSGHATSALSATDLAVALFFNKLRFDINHADNPNNDRVIFSKGHASPLLYALWGAAGVLSEAELLTYRQFESPLEGHPTPRFKYAEVATGSLGQGLSIGLGMALAMRLEPQNFAGPVSGFPPASAHQLFYRPQVDKSVAVAKKKSRLRAVGSPSTTATRKILPKVYVLMGDSEVSEGSVWEAIQVASYYGVNNLVGIIDVNRLGQAGETMLGWDVESYKNRIEAFGWRAYVCDGHDFDQILEVMDKVSGKTDRPQMVIAKTVKGKGVSFLENKDGWHGKALSDEQYQEALKELGEIDRKVRGEINKPILNIKYQISNISKRPETRNQKLETSYKIGEMVATRKAYGEAITKLGEIDERIVCLDAEVANSTFAEIFAQKFPERFWQCFIAEQNMVGMALGMCKRGYIPFVSTFAAFFTRAHDQIRMAAYSLANIKFIGSHSGVSIGSDGPSQMGLEDLALFRSVFGSVVLVPGDAVSCAKLVAVAAGHDGMAYIRTARPATPIIYEGSEQFEIGGSKVLKAGKDDKLTIVACGICVVEALAAADDLAKEGIGVRVIDAYSIKPIDEVTLKRAAGETNNLVVTVEDHYIEGGLGDAVLSVFAASGVRVHKLAVCQLPMSGRTDELLDYEGISYQAIGKSIRKILEEVSKKKPVASQQP